MGATCSAKQNSAEKAQMEADKGIFTPEAAPKAPQKVEVNYWMRAEDSPPALNQLEAHAAEEAAEIENRVRQSSKTQPNQELASPVFAPAPPGAANNMAMHMNVPQAVSVR